MGVPGGLEPRIVHRKNERYIRDLRDRARSGLSINIQIHHSGTGARIMGGELLLGGCTRPFSSGFHSILAPAHRNAVYIRLMK